MDVAVCNDFVDFAFVYNEIIYVCSFCQSNVPWLLGNDVTDVYILSKF